MDIEQRATTMREVKRTGSQSSLESTPKEKFDEAHDIAKPVEEEEPARPSFAQRYRHYILAALAIVILGWWISATILQATRHRWYVLPVITSLLVIFNDKHRCIGFHKLYWLGRSCCKVRLPLYHLSS